MIWNVLPYNINICIYGDWHCLHLISRNSGENCVVFGWVDGQFLYPRRNEESSTVNSEDFHLHQRVHEGDPVIGPVEGAPEGVARAAVDAAEETTGNTKCNE